MIKLDKKLEEFANLCGDWDYRNIDMTAPHLQSIEIVKDNILICCELFSSKIDDYVFCDGGIYKDKSLVKEFKKLNLLDKSDVLNFMSKIEDLVDWDKVRYTLDEEVGLEKEKIIEVDDEYDETDDYYFEEATIIPAKNLGEDWAWHKYSDGSGHLESPEGKEYMLYDLQTNEYQVTREESYDFFPLSYYYADGVAPSEFNPFSYMEDEMLNHILPKEKNNDEINL